MEKKGDASFESMRQEIASAAKKETLKGSFSPKKKECLSPHKLIFESLAAQQNNG